MFEVFKAPDRTQPNRHSKKVFLAGSIDMGSAEDWQEKVTSELEKIGDQVDVTVFNPRRDDWDSSWTQEINNTQFFDQVMWEMDHIDNSDLVLVYFTEDSKSPITLLELGKVSEMNGKKVLVYCPEGFYRKGNVDITCYRKKIPVFEDFEDLIGEIKNALNYKESENEKPEKSTNESTDNIIPESEKEKENVNESLQENQIKLKDFHDKPVFEYTSGDKNLLIVEDFEYIENSCMMGKIRFKDRTIYSGICNEDGQTKVTMNVEKSDGSTESINFELSKSSDSETITEGIVLSNQNTL
jgi:hypothetical protein